MQIQITQIHFKDPKIKAYAEKKVGKLTKFHPKIEAILVNLVSERAHRNQKHDYICELVVTIPHHKLEIIDKEREMDKAIDKAIERMKRVLTKHKEKHLTKKHKEGLVAKLVKRVRR